MSSSVSSGNSSLEHLSHSQGSFDAEVGGLQQYQQHQHEDFVTGHEQQQQQATAREYHRQQQQQPGRTTVRDDSNNNSFRSSRIQTGRGDTFTTIPEDEALSLAPKEEDIIIEAEVISAVSSVQAAQHTRPVKKQSPKPTSTNGSTPGAVFVANEPEQSRSVDSKTGLKGLFNRRTSSASLRSRKWNLLNWNRSDDVSVGVGEDEETTVVPATTPPVMRSIDMLPSDMDNVSPAGSIFHDEGRSVVSEVTNGTLLTVPTNNSNNNNFSMDSVYNISMDASVDMRGDQTVMTTSSLATEGIVNTSSAIYHQRMASRRPAEQRQYENSSTEEGTSGDSADGDNHQFDQTRMVIDEQGNFTILEDNTKSNIKKIPGWWCERCGIEQTHQKESYGPFGLLSYMAPQTIEGRIYKGYCLCCHDVYNLRRLLNDPDIPLGLIRYDSNTSSSLRRLRGSRQHSMTEDDGDDLFAMTPPRRTKHSPMEVLISSSQFQIVVGVVLLTVIATSIAIGVSMGRNVEPWVPPPPSAMPSLAPTQTFPTLAPSHFDWRRVMTITPATNVESFGYHVDLSFDGTILAVTSPKHNGKRGQLDIFRLDTSGNDDSWEVIGDPVVGELVGDMLGMGMDLSGDGVTVAVGIPGNNAGLVKVYTIKDGKRLIQKGQTISGPAPLSQFGYAISLSVDGLRMSVGAPQFGDDPSESYGMVQTYDFDGSAWVQLGLNIIGKNPGSQFGSSISATTLGKRLVIGAPFDIGKGVDAGRMYIFDFDDTEWMEVNSGFKLYGSHEGSQLGKQVAMHCGGRYFSGIGHDRTIEKVPNAGVLKTWSLVNVEIGPYLYGDPISGQIQGTSLGHDLAINCRPKSGVVGIVSETNVVGRAGSVYVEPLDAGVTDETASFIGPELGNAEWLGKGPSVAISGHRVAIGYESALSGGVSRSEIHIHDVVQLN